MSQIGGRFIEVPLRPVSCRVVSSKVLAASGDR